MGFGGASEGPSAEDVLSDFRAHVETALQEMSSQAAEGWAAGGADGPPAAAAAAAKPQVLGTATSQGLGLAFPEGAALQCLRVLCGPPGPLLLQWRYVGKFSGTYKDSQGAAVQGRGQIVDIEGVCQARIGAEGRAENLELFYNVPGLISAMLTDAAAAADDAACPVTGRSGVCPVLGVRSSA